MTFNNISGTGMSLPGIVIGSAFSKYVTELKGCHINVQSLLPNVDELRLTVLNSGIDFVSVCETWLREDINSSAVGIDQFNLIRKDRVEKPLGYGGVCLYLRKDIKYRIIKLHESISKKLKSDLEYLFVEIIISGRKILQASLYNPPKSKKTLSSTF